ncbi:unnamed protein product [Arabis nemorensis]|uniref:BTB domain-containing protein n=1 Tax=Arabis nemorensis TaxID=586526 RepID=A0A565BPG5_9BRAS|nr:unnamed protein product [Arabis nemorensis]
MDDFEYEPLHDFTNHMYQHVISSVFISEGGEDPRRVTVYKLCIMAKSKLLTLRLSEIEDYETLTLDLLTFEQISFLIQTYFYHPVPIIPEQLLREHAKTFYIAAKYYGLRLLREIARDWISSHFTINSALCRLVIYGILFTHMEAAFAEHDDVETKEEAILLDNTKIRTSALAFLAHSLQSVSTTVDFPEFVQANPNLTLDLIRYIATQHKCPQCKTRNQFY